MKSIFWMVWMLGVLLLMAALDKIPDPPAANPNAVQLSASCQHVAASTPVAFIAVPLRAPVGNVAADAVELPPYKDAIVLIERATDPSPPSSPLQL